MNIITTIIFAIAFVTSSLILLRAVYQLAVYGFMSTSHRVLSTGGSILTMIASSSWVIASGTALFNG